ncbi:MAG TPA: elongation factor G [Actinomycetota bacterium]
MKTYPSDKIRNVVLVGHGGSGKTSIAEALALVAGLTTRVGRVEDGNTLTDFDPDETAKGNSISLAMLPIEWRDHKINLLDAPGYADFVGDMEAGMRAADAAIIVVSAVDGVEVQARVAWDIAEHFNLPRAILINKLDRERANYHTTLEQLSDLFGAKIAPVHLPVGAEHDFSGIVDLLDEKGYTYADGKRTETDPGDLAGDLEKLHERLVESVVEADDAMMERYLEGETIDPKEIIEGLHKAVARGTTVPVLCGAATATIGMDLLLDFISDEMPSPLDRGVVTARAGAGDGEVEVELKPDPNGPLVAQVFKTLSDPYVGRLTYFRVWSGTMRPDSTVHNSTRKGEERLGHLFTMRGKDHIDVPEVAAGDIGAVAKLNDTVTGDTLTASGDETQMPPLEFPEPVFHLAIAPKSKGDEDKLSTALQRVAAEDPAFRWERNPDTHQTVISGMGEGHLDVVVHRLGRHHVEVDMFPPRVAYRETVRGKASAEGRHVKQSGGRGQYAKCTIEISPLPRGQGYEYENAIVGGAVPNQFIPSVDKGVRAAMDGGVLAGYKFVDFKVRLFDGKFHSVDSSDIAFQLAGQHAFKEAAQAAGVVLLEPVMDLTVLIPDEAVGDVMGDLSSRRARIEGTEALGKGWTQIKAKVPQGEVLRYAIDLRSKTGGRGSFSLTFSHYEETPPHVQEKVVAEAQAEKDAEKK